MSNSKILAYVCLLGLLFPILNCGTGHEAEEKYFLVASNIQVPYWQTAGAGFSQAAKDLKVRAEFVGPDTFDPKAQQQAFQKVVTQKPTGILVSSADPQLMKADIDKAIAAGIAVVTMDSDAPTSKRLFFIGTNNYQAGVTGGQRLAKELHGKGNGIGRASGKERGENSVVAGSFKKKK